MNADLNYRRYESTTSVVPDYQEFDKSNKPALLNDRKAWASIKPGKILSRSPNRNELFSLFQKNIGYDETNQFRINASHGVIEKPTQKNLAKKQRREEESRAEVEFWQEQNKINRERSDVLKKQFNRDIHLFVESTIQTLIDKMEKGEFDPKDSYSKKGTSYLNVLKKIKECFNAKIFKYAEKSIHQLFGDAKKQSINTETIPALKKENFKGLFREAVLEDRITFVNDPDFNIENSFKKLIEKDDFSPQVLEKFEIEYKELCQRYKGSETQEPEFLSFSDVKDIFRTYVEEFTKKNGPKQSGIHPSVAPNDVADLDD